ncbi:MAG: helix-turn-helix domain-containing protein [Ruminococcus sp.]|nr:helix-turn-helix domain-containing protein [Ruminococcus sp.]
MKNAQSTEKLLISPAEACEMLGIGRTTMYRLIHEGTVPVVKFPHCRKLYLSVETLKQIILDNMSSSSEIVGEENE